MRRFSLGGGSSSAEHAFTATLTVHSLALPTDSAASVDRVRVTANLGVPAKRGKGGTNATVSTRFVSLDRTTRKRADQSACAPSICHCMIEETLVLRARLTRNKKAAWKAAPCEFRVLTNMSAADGGTLMGTMDLAEVAVADCTRPMTLACGAALLMVTCRLLPTEEEGAAGGDDEAAEGDGAIFEAA